MTDEEVTSLISKHEAVIHNAAISACCDVLLRKIRMSGRKNEKAALDEAYHQLKALKR